MAPLPWPLLFPAAVQSADSPLASPQVQQAEPKQPASAVPS